MLFSPKYILYNLKKANKMTNILDFCCQYFSWNGKRFKGMIVYLMIVKMIVKKQSLRRSLFYFNFQCNNIHEHYYLKSLLFQIVTYLVYPHQIFSEPKCLVKYNKNCQVSRMECFAKIGNSFQPLNIFKAPHFRCLARF